eukprot:scpid102010/ scgid33918/ 
MIYFQKHIKPLEAPSNLRAYQQGRRCRQGSQQSSLQQCMRLRAAQEHWYLLGVNFDKLNRTNIRYDEQIRIRRTNTNTFTRRSATSSGIVGWWNGFHFLFVPAAVLVPVAVSVTDSASSRISSSRLGGSASMLE